MIAADGSRLSREPVQRDQRADREEPPDPRLAKAQALDQQHAAHDQHDPPDPVPDQRQRADRDALAEDRGEAPDEDREVHQRVGGA